MYEFIVRKSRLDAHQLNPMMGYDTKAIRILNSEMLGGLNNKSALNRNEVRSNIALSMLKEAFLYSPSIIGKKFYWSEFIPVGLDGEESDDESSDDDSVGETYGLPNHIDEGSSLDFVSKPPEEEVEANEKLFAHYTLRNPIKVILQIAWPNSWKDVFRGWADFLFPLRIADVLFYGVTTCLEAAFRGLGKLLLMPFNYLLINPLKKAIMGYDVSGWSLLGLIPGILIGLPLGLIGQSAIFIGNTFQHARLFMDGIFNIIPSFISKIVGGSGTTVPEFSACILSSLRTLPFLILDALVIAACFVPGGQIATLLGSLGNGAAASAFASLISHVVVPLGNFFGGFFTPLANSFVGASISELASQTLAATVLIPVLSFFQNAATSLLNQLKKHSFFQWKRKEKSFTPESPSIREEEIEWVGDESRNNSYTKNYRVILDSTATKDSHTQGMANETEETQSPFDYVTSMKVNTKKLVRQYDADNFGIDYKRDDERDDDSPTLLTRARSLSDDSSFLKRDLRKRNPKALFSADSDDDNDSDLSSENSYNLN